MKQYVFLGTINNNFIEFDPAIKQLGIQTSRSGYKFKFYLNNNSTPKDPIIIGNTKIYEIDLSDTDLLINKIEILDKDQGFIFGDNDYIIIDTLEGGGS